MSDITQIEDFKEVYGDQYTDWRLPENRVEAFTRVYDVRMREGELDHWLAGKIIAKYMNLTDEQKAWYCLLFGFSYRNHWAMIVLQLFPEIWKTDVEKIRTWYNDSDENNQFGAWRRAKFAKDTKWNVRKFPDFIASVQKWLNGDNLYDRLKKISSVGTTAENFDNLNSELTKNLHGIGRMTAWLTEQTIYEFFNFDINKIDLQLHDDGCWSQYDAMCYLYNKMDWQGEKKTKERLKFMSEKTDELVKYMENRLPYTIDIYNVESCLCEFRKTTRTDKKAKEFTGWTANELMAQYEELYELWENHDKKIDWDPYILGILLKGPYLGKTGYSTEYFRIMVETGMNFNTHYYYPDEPDAYELVDIPKPEDCPQPTVLLDHFKKIDAKLVADYKKEFAPELHLRWKNLVKTS